MQTGPVERAGNLLVLQQSLELRAEIYIGSLPMQVQRLDSQPIPAEHQPFVRLAPERHREHAPKLPEALRIPLEKGMERDLGIAMSVEAMAEGFEFTAQLGVIVDLAVEDDDRLPVVAPERLISSAQVDNFEAHRAQRDVPCLKRALLIGPAMDQRAGDPPDNTNVYSPFPMGKTRNSTQDAKSPLV